MSRKKLVKPHFVSPGGVNANVLLAHLKTTFHSHMHYNEEAIRPDSKDSARDNANIYALCYRQRVRLVSQSLFVDHDAGAMTGLLEVNYGEHADYVPFQLDVESLRQGIISDPEIPKKPIAAMMFDCEVVENERSKLMYLVSIQFQDGSKYAYKKQVELDALTSHFRWHVRELQDLDIQYIGMSTGSKSVSNAVKRLQRHEHRTSLTNGQVRRGDLDLICLYLDFEATLGDDVEIEMPSPNIIKLIEGGLIYHFKPSENDHDKIRFPEAVPDRNELQKLGVDEMHIVMSSDSAGYRFQSNVRPPRHFAVISQEFDNERYAHDLTLEQFRSEVPPDPDSGWKQLCFTRENEDYIATVKEQALQRFRKNGGKIGNSYRPAVSPLLEAAIRHTQNGSHNQLSWISSFARSFQKHMIGNSATPDFSSLILEKVQQVAAKLYQRHVNEMRIRGFSGATSSLSNVLDTSTRQLTNSLQNINAAFPKLLAASIKMESAEGTRIAEYKRLMMHELIKTSVVSDHDIQPVLNNLRSDMSGMSLGKIKETIDSLEMAIALFDQHLQEVDLVESNIPIGQGRSTRKRSKTSSEVVDEFQNSTAPSLRYGRNPSGFKP